MQWARENHDWPHSQSSEFVKVGAMRWHVQKLGSGLPILLLHGSGASTHSFAQLMEILSKDYLVLAIDLPGHGFSKALTDKSPTLPNVALVTGDLLGELDVAPRFIIGHSAGAAIAAEMVCSGMCKPEAVFAINGAFYPFPGFSGQLFPAMAKLLFLNPLVPGFFAATASEHRVKKLIDSTGSVLSAKQISYYERLFSSSGHVRGTLAMMANWDLSEMAKKIKSFECPLHHLIGEKDGTIDPVASIELLKANALATRMVFEDAGHLLHEEVAEVLAEKIYQLTKV